MTLLEPVHRPLAYAARHDPSHVMASAAALWKGAQVYEAPGN